LECGKIICELEGEGPCLFCGALADLNESDTDAQKKALAHRDKLLEYARSGSKYTRVYGMIY
jgi:hypothetical protein